jgi:hypothetical protein
MTTKTEITGDALAAAQEVRINIGWTANDYGGWTIKSHFIKAVSLADAVAMFNHTRDIGGYGARDQCKNCGDILDTNGKKIAEVSYNGRVWAI